MSIVSKAFARLTRACAKIAGTSFWPARGPTTAGDAAEMPVDMVCLMASVPIARANKYISTGLLEAAFTEKPYKK